MEALIGIRGKNWSIVAADTNVARSIVVMKSTETKFRDLSPTLTMTYSGEPGDAVNFAEYLQANLKLYEMKNERPLSGKAAASFTRRLIADGLRSRTPYQTNVLLGGPGELYWIDYMGTLVELPFAAHGYAAYFVLSLMDRNWREGMSIDEGLELMKMCIQELKVRFLVNFPTFCVKIVKPEGIEMISISL